MKFRSLFLKLSFACFIFLNAHSSFSAFLSKTEFYQIEGTTNSIIRSFPKEKYFYFGIGRSPTPLIAYLQTIEGVFAKNIPFSSGSRGNFKRSQVIQFFDHLDRFLPDIDQLRGRNILLIDYCLSGTGLYQADLLFNKYFSLKNQPIEIRSLCLASDFIKFEITSSYPNLAIYPFPDLNHDPNGFSGALRSKAYSSIAEYQSFPISGPVPDFVKNPKYEALIAEIQHAKENPSDHLFAPYNNPGYIIRSKIRPQIMSLIQDGNDFATAREIFEQQNSDELKDEQYRMLAESHFYWCEKESKKKAEKEPETESHETPEKQQFTFRSIFRYLMDVKIPRGQFNF